MMGKDRSSVGFNSAVVQWQELVCNNGLKYAGNWQKIERSQKEKLTLYMYDRFCWNVCFPFLTVKKTKRILGSGGCPKTSYLTDNTQHIVFSCVEPAIVLTYDTMVGVHSVWKVRRARLDVSHQMTIQSHLVYIKVCYI